MWTRGGGGYWELFYPYPHRYLFLTNRTEMLLSESLLWTLKNLRFLWSPEKMQVSPGHNHLEGVAVQLKVQSLGTRPLGRHLGTDEGEREREAEALKGKTLKTIHKPSRFLPIITSEKPRFLLKDAG